MANVLNVAGPNSTYAQPAARPAGFFAGFWHGVILPVTWVLSWFLPGVRIYETNNNGGWYEFGFVLGISGSVGGSGSVT